MAALWMSGARAQMSGTSCKVTRRVRPVARQTCRYCVTRTCLMGGIFSSDEARLRRSVEDVVDLRHELNQATCAAIAQLVGKPQIERREVCKRMVEDYDLEGWAMQAPGRFTDNLIEVIIDTARVDVPD